MVTAKPATAKSYLNGLRSFHQESGFSTIVFDDPRVDLVIRGGKRVYGEGIKRLRFPLTASILLRIVNEIKLDEEGINIKSALCVAFAAFLRSGEFTWNTWSEQHHKSYISRKHISFNTNSVTLTLPASKTDPYHKGVNIHLASSSSPLCPVAALVQLFKTYPCSPFQPLFTRPHGQAFTKQYVLLRIHELLFQAGIPTAGFSGHSIRKGAAVTAAANGISREDIKLLGRWKSDAVDAYINEIKESDHIHKLLQLNSQLLNSTPFYPLLSGAASFR
ncbi:MAG: hypothetical protein E6J34_24290, partial [Chloroflexi bacterium]